MEVRVVWTSLQAVNIQLVRYENMNLVLILQSTVSMQGRVRKEEIRTSPVFQNPNSNEATKASKNKLRGIAMDDDVL
jgi:hypothetical protein